MPQSYADVLTQARKDVRDLSVDELKARVGKDDLVLVDVREKEEYRAGYIPGAVSVPRGYLEQNIEARVPNKETHVVVYCAGGSRAFLAAMTLKQFGYKNVEVFGAGMPRWRDNGLPVEQPPKLTDAQRERYSRHLLLPEVGELGQVKLLKAKVLLLGAGGLGSPAALYLAAAGVGTLGIVDADTVDASNLQRQIIHATSRVGMPKVESAAKTIADLNPDVKVIPHPERLTSANVERLFGDYDVVVDGTDNFPTRYLVNDASVFLGKPVVHGSIFRFDGQVTTFVPKSAAQKFGVPESPCYRCLYPEPPPPHLAPSCQEAGVLGILCGIIGTIQATEAIKLILGKGEVLSGRLLTYDSLKMRFAELRLRKDKTCPVCGNAPKITNYVDYEGFCAIGA